MQSFSIAQNTFIYLSKGEISPPICDNQNTYFPTTVQENKKIQSEMDDV